ncbi:MAG: hypothetical protein D3907_01160, partial [Candidatus Electrothrix sp. AUS3]|nr:hypothetical protein [Candidatus Electrothrix gigas]
GWLTGLSISPVVATVLSGILGAVLFLAAFLSGFSYGDNASLIKNISDISPVPFAWLMLGIIAGTSLGILVRTNNVLGIVSVEKQDNSFTQLQAELTQLKEQEDTEEQKKGKWEGLDISLSDIAQRIIDKHYPKGGAVNKSAGADSGEKTAHSFSGLTGAIGPIDSPACDELLTSQLIGKVQYINKNSENLPELASLLERFDADLDKKVRSQCKQPSSE